MITAALGFIAVAFVLAVLTVALFLWSAINDIYEDDDEVEW